MSLGDVVHGSDAGAPAHADDRATLLDMSRLAQRAAQIKDVIALVQFLQQSRALAENQIYDGDGAVFTVGVRNGQRDSYNFV